MSDNALTRFIGGSPVAVTVRLLLVSLLVGAFMVWNGIHLSNILLVVQAALSRLWAAGFDSLRDIGQYVLAGAVIVVPVWLVMRVMSARGR